MLILFKSFVELINKAIWFWAFLCWQIFSEWLASLFCSVWAPVQARMHSAKIYTHCHEPHPTSLSLGDSPVIPRMRYWSGPPKENHPRFSGSWMSMLGSSFPTGETVGQGGPPWYQPGKGVIQPKWNHSSYPSNAVFCWGGPRGGFKSLCVWNLHKGIRSADIY